MFALINKGRKNQWRGKMKCESFIVINLDGRSEAFIIN